MIRDIEQQIAGDKTLQDTFRRELWQTERVRTQKPRDDKGRHVYALHAPEVECIGKGKSHKPWEFGVKVSVATPIKRSRGGQFVVHAMALPGKPHDGHTLHAVLPDIERLVEALVQRVLTDAGYRGHKLPLPWKFTACPRESGDRVDGQKRRVTKAIKRLMKRRAAVEPVIGPLKAEHRMGRNYLAHRMGDAINTILAAVRYNFRRLRLFIAQLLLRFIRILLFGLTQRRQAMPATPHSQLFTFDSCRQQYLDTGNFVVSST